MKTKTLDLIVGIWVKVWLSLIFLAFAIVPRACGQNFDERFYKSNVKHALCQTTENHAIQHTKETRLVSRVHVDFFEGDPFDFTVGYSPNWTKGGAHCGEFQDTMEKLLHDRGEPKVKVSQN